MKQSASYKTQSYIFVLILLLLCAVSGLVKAQSSVVVPEQIEFAGIKLNLSDRYRDSIRKASEGLLKNNRYFRLTVERADAYFGIVERVLSEEQAPDDMKYLVLQESKLVSDVVSGSNAVGYWQFKKETAQEVGLRVDDEVDERMNIVASTRGAAKYLRRHNVILQNWLYSVLSYYAGLTGARSVINKDSKEYANLKEMNLDESTHWYITKFLAHKLAYETAIHRNPTLPLQVLEYAECENKTLEEIALATNVPLEDLAFYNKWARKGAIPGDKDYTVLLPVKTADQPVYMAMQNKPEPGKSENLKPYKKTYLFGLISVDADPPKEPEVATADAQSPNAEYKSTAPIFFSWNGIKAIMARKGDNIARLALQADIDKEDFLDYNDMRVFDQIVAGQVYYIKSKNKKAAVPYHVVKEGETLWEISQSYGIKMSQLMKKNLMSKPEKLRAGRVIWMRHTRPENAPIEYMPVPASAPLIPLKPDSSKMKPAGTSPAIQAKLLDTNNVEFPPLTNSDSTYMLVDKDDAKQALQAPGDTTKAVVTKSKHETKPVLAQIASALKTDDTDTPPARPGFDVMVLQPGQTLYGLSKSLLVNMDSLRAWNGLESKGLQLGMPLYYKKQAPINSNQVADTTLMARNVPKPAPVVKETKAELKAEPKAEAKIEPKAEVKTEAKVENKTEAKTEAKVESPTPVIAASSGAEYIVKQGDTMYKIARENGVSVKDLLEINNKTAPAVAIGEKLKVKR